ncbi:MAG: adenosine kinase [Proteobacteria bacterium]|nr:adenosine kinase [Pseudomonadota bacterium]
MKSLDVISICNALVDILVQAKDQDIETLGLNRGIMHLVDDARQMQVIEHFSNQATTRELGGSSLNAIRTLASLGANTSFAGSIGADSYGEMIENRLKELGIKGHIHKIKAHTGLCFILVSPDGERTMNTNLGASCLYDESIVPDADIERARVFHFCGYQWANPGQIRAIKRALDIARSNDTLVSFDLADPFVVRSCKQDFIPLIEDYADIVFSNREESSLLFDSSPETACNFIADAGAIAAIKLGAEGALIGHGTKRIQDKPVPTTVIDTTAAGDMFAAGFLYGVCQGKALEVCGRMAAELASDVIGRLGGTVSHAALQRVKAL